MPVVEINGQKVSYEEAGNGLPVVFIPGLAETKEWFRYQMSGLSENYRTITYDLRANPKNGEYSARLLVDDLARFLDALHIQSAAVCGHSFGGIVAQEFAISYPDRTSALCLISAFPALPSEHAEKLLSWLSPKGTAGHRNPLEWLRGLFAGRQPDCVSYECLAEQSAHAGRSAVEARLRLIQSYDSTSRLGEIDAPTLIVVGAKDRAEILHSAQILYEGIPDVTLEVIEGGDHFCFFHRHDLVNAALDDFLTARLASLS
ncbi:MAG: alpha/beta hydrolase [Armatimonadota bacterium]|nr:alpha/beta hydrolase [Armatimonadota bacterium]